MNKKSLLLATLFLSTQLAGFGALAKLEPYAEIAVRILSVVDGDTVKVKILDREVRALVAEELEGKKRERFVESRGEISVRMLNHDTPESKFGKHAQKSFVRGEEVNWGDLAYKQLQTLLKAGEDATARLGEKATGKYGRLLAEVINEDGVNTNLEMVRRGWSFPFLFAPLPPEISTNEYVAAMEEAQQNLVGLWREGPEGYEPVIEYPTDFRTRVGGKDDVPFVGDRETGLVYPYSERHKISAKNWVFFLNEELVEEAGFRMALTQP